jgi:hypothetical protein
MKMKIFLRMGMDSKQVICPSGWKIARIGDLSAEARIPKHNPPLHQDGGLRIANPPAEWRPAISY